MDEVLAVDSIAQRLWIGAWNHIYCYNLKDERFVTISDSTVYQTVRMDTVPPVELSWHIRSTVFIE